MIYILFNDNSWKYTFIILLGTIVLCCGIYTFLKSKKINKKEIEIKDEHDSYTNQVLDDEEIILKKKK